MSGHRWSSVELRGAQQLLGESRTLEDALQKISNEVRPVAHRQRLWDAFKRAGLGNPSDYLAKVAKKPAKAAPGLTRILVIPDTHAPFHSEGAWAVAKAAAFNLQPDALVVIGDFADCYSVSRYPKSAARRTSLKSELDVARRMLHEIAPCAPQRIFCEGNHEWRLERFINERAPELYGLVGIKELLLDPADEWTWVPYQSWTQIGKMAFSHDVGRSGVNAGRQTLQEFGGNICFGHTHRGGVVYESTLKGEHRVALNCGWLGDPAQIDYVHRASALRNSQHGFGWVVQDSSGLSWAQFIPIIEERCCVVDGQRFAI